MFVSIGTRGEEFFRSWRPDAVVTDLMLPDIDGIEQVRKFKALILNMSNSGRLPRQQVHQTLIDLLALGK